MTQQTAKIIDLASQLSKALTTSTRTTSGEKYVHLKDGSPDWMRDVVHAVHGDSMPNDFIYRFIEKAADAIAEAAADAELSDVINEIAPEVYTHDLMKWAADNCEYCDQYMREMGDSYPGYVELASCGQALHIQEIGNALVSELEKIADQ